MDLNFIKGTYTINADGSYDVDGYVDLDNNRLTKLPIRFGKVSGNFFCSGNNLTSLEGCPSEVSGDFYCHNNQLSSLKGSPVEVDGSFNCSKNKLTTLEGSPKAVGRDFDCSSNNLTSLEGSPKEVGGDFDCSNNKLYNFKGISIIKGDIYSYNNPVHEIYQLCPTYEFIKYLNEFTPIRGKTILGKRLQDCLYMCDREVDVTELVFKNYILLE